MLPLKFRPSPRWPWVAIASLSLVILGAHPPTPGHQVQVATDVGATLHIEPNDMPQAGVPSDLWIALTQVGGTPIPLEHCDCALAVYDSTGSLVAEPPLTPVSPEDYRQIPGATVTFPQVGAYGLVVTGQPQGDGNFSPFELTFEVLVATAAAPPPQTREEADPPGDDPEVAAEVTPENSIPEALGDSLGEPQTPGATSSQQSPGQLGWLGWAGGGLVAVTIAGGMFYYGRSRGNKG